MTDSQTDSQIVEECESGLLKAWEAGASREELLETLHNFDECISELETKQYRLARYAKAVAKINKRLSGTVGDLKHELSLVNIEIEQHNTPQPPPKAP